MARSRIPSHPGAGRPLSSRPTGPGTAFANFLIGYLPTLGKTNEELAQALGYARPNIVSMWKTAKTKVTLDALWGLAELLDVDLAYLLVLYFEQYVGDNAGGVSHFPELVKLMGRITTPEEWEIIAAVREARRYHSLPMTRAQRTVIKDAFRLPASTPEGPLKQQELRFLTCGDRRKFARRGQPRDMSVDEIEDAVSKSGARPKVGNVRQAGKRARSKT